MTDAQSKLVVVTAGLGRAGGNPNILHGAVWDTQLRQEYLAQGIDYLHLGHDTDEDRRDAARRNMTHMTVFNSVEDLPYFIAETGQVIDVLDVTTATENHAPALADFLRVLMQAGLDLPKSIIVEKPLVNSDSQLRHMEEILAEYEIELSTFGIEHYLNSPALREAVRLIRQEISNKNSVLKIVVDFSKDRVPDVRDRGRFQDDPHNQSLLSSLGIEPPHMIPLVEALLGENLDFRLKTYDGGGDIVDCRLFHNIDKIPESEGTFIKALHGDTEVIVKQALGPFSIDDEGVLSRYDWGKEISRTVSVTFADDRGIDIIFDPVPGCDRFQCRLVRWRKDGESKIEESPPVTGPDESLPDTLRAVAQFAMSGVRGEALDGMDVRSAMRRFSDLMALRRIGGEQIRVPSLDRRSAARRQASR